jgi:protein involved in polysaccharide export with SLBB domain
MKTIRVLLTVAAFGCSTFQCGAAADQPGSNEKVAVLVLSKERQSPSDVHIYGEFKGGEGFLAWREGLTLRQAISAAGGFKAVAGGVRIYVSDSRAQKRGDIKYREIKADPKILDYLLEKADGVDAWTQL